MWFSKNNLPLSGKTAVVLGASQGLGAEFGRRLYLEGCSVILVARTESKLKKHKDAIQATDKVIPPECTISYAVCDVSDYDSVLGFFHKMMAIENIDPDYVFSFVGLAIPKLFNDLTKEDLVSGYQTNYVANANVAHVFVNQVMAINKQTSRKQFKKRVLCMCSSVVSFYPVIGYSSYAPSKAALDSLCTILRAELKPYNFRVATIFPGNFESEGYIQEEKTKPEITKIVEGPSTPITVEKCADIILDKLNKGYDTITTDTIGWIVSCFGLGMYPRQWGFLQIIKQSKNKNE
ncbi:3-dehydrosphinganine reductase [Scheffersomyces spartinae]|uniref:3-ketodihydrosphingosine reductase TSC10 n=1 Tax=Scheffersomyces spartinae TaxID=45513 RepID=A0A9P7VB88_9ASCO|nr:3-dehydrosphinganine reductase [Scheffersomyces spartinae]KAG7194184.1 3-dehydrosphinganine reductase [Scheffersomyces spartinae]